MPTITPWQTPPQTITLEEDEVHVWRAALNLPAARLRCLWDTLTADEQDRAARFRFRRDQDGFVAARGLLRAILARYLEAAPGDLRFCTGPHGKPALEHPGDDLRFNLAHSHGLALYAVARGREVGIDLERVRPEAASEGIAGRFFSPREVAALQALQPEARTEAFFACWTRKEAYLKARGEGLALPLNRFDVSLAPGEPAALLEVRGEPQEAERWTLQALDAGPGYAAALAAEGRGWRIRCWQLE